MDEEPFLFYFHTLLCRYGNMYMLLVMFPPLMSESPNLDYINHIHQETVFVNLKGCFHYLSSTSSSQLYPCQSRLNCCCLFSNFFIAACCCCEYMSFCCHRHHHLFRSLVVLLSFLSLFIIFVSFCCFCFVHLFVCFVNIITSSLWQHNAASRHDCCCCCCYLFVINIIIIIVDVRLLCCYLLCFPFCCC